MQGLCTYREWHKALQRLQIWTMGLERLDCPDTYLYKRADDNFSLLRRPYLLGVGHYYRQRGSVCQ